ncbi:Thyroid adenoma-associated protein like protein [Habropoda laboriosa]|uniref:Thyroid adenoma-associated protein like protein n=1 Tax=Habropoda laboriosa TaxID=597456 RepID=A0A0L7RIM3_9HYME|nr:PREDICTED: uncharacterized protein LOC108573614 [Habropoda laboriosa]KOC70581.1 Thyroid adenoma-associated protein like protein [Habropoda laboriosa]
MCTKNMELNHIIKELQTCTEDTIIFRKLINFASSCKESWDDEYIKQWQPVLVHIIEIFIPNTEIRRERTLLASHTFFVLLSMQPTSVLLKDTFTNFLTFKCNEVYVFDKKYGINEPELFKLICAHGYLQANRKEMYSNDICLLIFDLIFEHCVRYTKHSYFAYKILYMWLQRTMNTNLWSTCSADLHIEQQLEKIIFSNWHNAINEINKQNSALIFNMYLKIMDKKYSGYLEYLFKHCVDTISWQNELKYDILAEICEVWDKIEVMTSRDFLLSLCTSLTKYYLRSAGTKVYLAIVKKLSENEWEKAFGDIINYLFHHWESVENENYDALQLLWKHWLKPVVKKYRNILPYLWELTRDIKTHFIRSHLQKIACEMHIVLPQQASVECYIYRSNKIVRLNGFAINCYEAINIYNENKDRFFTIRNFLWHNANSTTVYMRDRIVKYFKVFYANVLKMCDSRTDCIHDVYYITYWLHEFLLDCFELGSCYQRNILGINLYEAILSFTDGHVINKSNNMENTLIEKHLKTTDNWKFTNKRSLIVLITLALNSTLDVKRIAISVILKYFDKNILSDMDKRALFGMVLNSNTWNRDDTESGATLMLILANWLPPIDNVLVVDEHGRDIDYNNSKYSNYLLIKATKQLTDMKRNIHLTVLYQHHPFYGLMAALLNITFRNGPESSCLTLQFVEKTLDLLEDAVDFVLAKLYLGSKNNENYSSSFAKTGLAINTMIENSKLDDNDFILKVTGLKIYNIWKCLKISCEIASEIGALMYTDETVRRSINIIVTVLLRCRHKGAVDAAGTAIGHLMRCLCKESKYSDLPKEHILCILEHHSKLYLKSITRVDVLSIMFHRIVLSDNRKDRPLLHFAVKRLLNILDNTCDDIFKCTKAQPNSPSARYLHFLRALVSDKEMHAQLIPYIERISLTCFRYMQCEVWNIKNASLQLFGSIVPRLVGQNSGDKLEFGNRYSTNHFVTHYPVLADYIMEELQRFLSMCKERPTALYPHSSIVHILILLSQFSSSACNLIDYSSQNYVLQVKYLLHMFFKSPILHVRLLAAKAYAGLTDFLQIELTFEKLKRTISSCRNINLIHGYLLAMKFLKEKFSVEMENMNLRSDVKQYKKLRLRDISEIWNNNPQKCYILEKLFLQLQETFTDELYHFNVNVSLLSSEKTKPGFFQFINHSTKLYADYINRTNNIDIVIVQTILDSSCIDQSISFINHVSPSVPVMRIVLKNLMLNKHNELLLSRMTNYVLKTLKHCPLSDIKEISFAEIVNLSNGPVPLPEMLKDVLVIIFYDNMEMIFPLLFHYVVFYSMHPDEHFRRLAAEYMHLSVRRFTEFTKKCKLIILHGCLILLKDEIPEIGETIAKSLRIYVLPTISTKYDMLEHGEYIYQKLLFEVMAERLNFSKEKDMNLLFMKLFTMSIEKNFGTECLMANLNDDDLLYRYNYYREESKFLNLCFYYMKRRHNRDKYPTKDDTTECNNENDLHIVNQIEKIHQFEQMCYSDVTTTVSYRHCTAHLLIKQRLVTSEYSNDSDSDESEAERNLSQIVNQLENQLTHLISRVLACE